MTTTPSTHRPFPARAPVDERGRLLHEGDAAAQLALCLANLEAALADARLAPAELVEVDVRTTDARLLGEVFDVLTDRLGATGSHPRISVTEVEDLGLPGLFVVLGGTTSTTHPTPEGSTMTLEPILDGPTGSPTASPTASPAESAADALRGLCGGRLHLPGDPGYDAARLPWNVAVDQRPAAVAVPHDTAEVAEVVRAAAAAGLRVAPQSSGHNAAPLAEHGLDGVVLVRLTEMTGVSIDPEARTARVIGGTLWRDVVAAAAPYGLAAMHGSSPDVAVAGYALGGGLSWYARQHGLATDSLVAVEVVTADGTVVLADAEHHAELFWALRGGGGNLGVVIALELRLLPVADVYAGMLLWDRERAPEVVPAWSEWTRDLPESVTTSMRVMSFPPLPDLPPFLSGRQLVVIDGAVLEGDDRAAELLAPLRALTPEMDTFARMPAAGLPEIHMDPPGPTPAVSDHAMLDGFGAEAVAALLAEVGPGTTTSLLFAEVRHLGGALGRPAPGGGVLDHLPDAYALFCVAIAPFPEAAAAGLADAERVVTALRPWSTGRRVLNFTEQAVDAGSGYGPDAWARLCRVRAEVDPSGVFLANHPIA